MTGGLIQIVNFGNQDIMLNGNPEITFFTSIYRRYTNFGKKYVLTSFDNEVGFNKTSTQVLFNEFDFSDKVKSNMEYIKNRWAKFLINKETKFW